MDSKSEQKHSDSLFVETNTPVTLKANASNEKDQHEIESQKIANKQGEPHHPSISEEIVKSIKTKPGIDFDFDFFFKKFVVRTLSVLFTVICNFFSF